MLMDLFVDSYYLPSALLKSEKYNDLSGSAKILYSVLLKKYIEAAQRGDRDRFGKVYITYSQKQMASDLHCSIRTIKRLMADLKEAGLIANVKQNSPGTNSSIFLNLLEAF